MPSHRVRRLRWQVRTGSREEAFAIRPRIRDVSDAVVAELGRVFDRLPLGDDVVHIDRLEVVVRVANADEVEPACVDAVRRQIAERVEAAAHPSTPGQTSRTRVERVDARHARREALLTYLETGLLPWPLSVPSDESPALMLEAATREEWRSILSDFPRPVRAPVFTFRLVTLLPETLWLEMAREVCGSWPFDGAQNIVKAIETVVAEPGRDRSTRLRMAAALVALAVRQERSLGAARGLPWMSRAVADLAVEDFAELPEVAMLFAPPEAIRQSGISMRESGPDAAAPDSSDRPAVETPARAPDQGSAKPIPADLTNEAAFTSPPSAALEMPGLLVPHAGLVLIVPFIPRLFEARAIASPGQPRLIPSVLPRACALLHFAATGREDGHEFEMAFAKVLLGLRPETPLPFASGALASGDREGVLEMLDAVIGHWRVLKRTSADGLRAAFLQRSGILLEEDVYWRVRMEPASIDLLLEHLPWSLSTVTLPWLSKPIVTEWTMR